MSSRFKTVLVCGGGNIAHAIATRLSLQGKTVNVLTRKPESWSKQITLICECEHYIASINKISDNPSELMENVDMIIVSSPLYAFRDIAMKFNMVELGDVPILTVPARLAQHEYVGTPFESQEHILIQRTPYICRIIKYGNEVEITGQARAPLKMWSRSRHHIVTVRHLFNIETEHIANPISMDLVNSNSLLHTCRLVSLFGKNQTFSEKPYFYKTWDDDSSKRLIKCDEELQNLISYMNEREPLPIQVADILTHYNVSDIKTLTSKIRSIPSLQSIRADVVWSTTENVYTANLSSRYFLEDLKGLNHIINMSQKYGIKCCNMLSVRTAIMAIMNNGAIITESKK